MRYVSIVLIALDALLITWLISLELEETPPTIPNDGQSGVGIMVVFLINLFSTVFFAFQFMIFVGIYIFKASMRNTTLLISLLISTIGLATGIFFLN
jgi:hypothetical protein